MISENFRRFAVPLTHPTSFVCTSCMLGKNVLLSLMTFHNHLPHPTLFLPYPLPVFENCGYLSQVGAEVSSIWTVILVALSDFCVTELSLWIGKCLGKVCQFLAHSLNLSNRLIANTPPSLIPPCLVKEQLPLLCSEDPNYGSSEAKKMEDGHSGAYWIILVPAGFKLCVIPGIVL